MITNQEAVIAATLAQNVYNDVQRFLDSYTQPDGTPSKKTGKPKKGE